MFPWTKLNLYVPLERAATLFVYRMHIFLGSLAHNNMVDNCFHDFPVHFELDIGYVYHTIPFSFSFFGETQQMGQGGGTVVLKF